jgi:hypothetical protein
VAARQQIAIRAGNGIKKLAENHGFPVDWVTPGYNYDVNDGKRRR